MSPTAYLDVVEILCPEVNLRPSHNTKTISIQIGSIAREVEIEHALTADLKAVFDSSTPPKPDQPLQLLL
jgi:hypothetical protein